MLKVRELVSGRGAVCDEVLRGLPDWFGIEASIRAYVQDVESLPFLVAEIEGTVVGFLALKLHTPEAAEIHVMGIGAAHHRHGLGRALVQAAERYVMARGRTYLQVKTLSPSRESAAYEATRRFYLSMGFAPLEEMPTLWGEGNPCLIMIKHLCAPLEDP